MQRPPRLLAGAAPFDAPEHRAPRLEILNDDMDSGGVEDPQQLERSRRYRPAEAQLNPWLAAGIRNRRDLGAKILLLFGEIADETSRQHEVNDPENRPIGFEILPGEERRVPRAGNPRLNEKDPDRHRRCQQGFAESPPIGGGKLNEQEKQEERTSRSAADERENSRPENIDAVENLAVAGAETCRAMHEREDDDTVKGVTEQDRVGEFREPCWLSWIDVNGDEAADG